MPGELSPLAPFLRKLELHMRLSAADREAVLSLPHAVKPLRAGAFLFREGDPARNCCVILSGFVCRHKVVAEGARQILSVHMKGDGVDLQSVMLDVADHNVQALTAVEVAYIPTQAILDLMPTHPAVVQAMWIETLVDASIQREWIANVGRRDARARVAHLLCEIGVKLEAAELARRDCFELPLTQEQVADATGLTSVHVNRVFQALRGEGAIGGRKRSLVIDDWARLAEVGDFRPTYLHGQAEAVGLA
jgi:CRP-like cAMP-binding protein